jgi:hypothetical protein
MLGRSGKGPAMALDTNTFIIVLIAVTVAMGFVAWAMYKKIS